MLGTPTRDRVAERRAGTRREILDAAWEVAREQGLAQITLRDVAERIGMRAPSLYSHFASKHAIYDAMFGDAWSELHARTVDLEERLPEHPRRALKLFAHTFFEFAAADLPRYQLMNQRTIAGFEPSAESYAPSVAALERLTAALAEFGITRQEDVDLYVAIVSGLVDAQLANDPGGRRWQRLVDRAMDMYADELGLPQEKRRR